MLSALVLSQTTDVNETARRNFLGFQVMAVLNSTLLDNLLMYSQPNAETLWTHLQTLIKMSGLWSVFTNYQRTIIFQISSDPASQITELNPLYTRLHENNCNIPLSLQINGLLNSLTQSI